MNKYIIIFLFGVFIGSCAQILLKLSSKEEHKNVISEYMNIKVITAYGMFFGAVFLNVIALKGINVKEAPVLEALGYIFILILSSIILKEKITKKKIVGNIIIIAGIIIFNL
jgi:drug/metabolite transporter (DMT)-like permease